MCGQTLIDVVSDHKVIIAFVSAIVAIIGAIFANITRVQTRKDIFAKRRDSLVLAMAENDGLCENLKFKVQHMRDHLDTLQAPHDIAISNFRTTLNEIENLSNTNNIREYDSMRIKNISYSEENSNIIQQMSLGEKENGIFYRRPAHDFIFELIQNLGPPNELQV